MREDLDSVLHIIDSEYLTDKEWLAAANVLCGRNDNKAKYQALFSVLSARGAQGSDLANLHIYYSGFGLSKKDLQAEQQRGVSNIFIGAVLED